MILGICLRTKNAVEYESETDTISKLNIWNSLQKFWKGKERVENRSTNRDNLHHRIVEIDQNTEKSPGDLKRLGITQTVVKNHQLTLVWKTQRMK